MENPSDPVAAVTHPDPYAYYTRLAERSGVVRDAALGSCIAASAGAARAVWASDLCAVRPRDEPVPRALLGTAAGEIFGRLVRTCDGERHATLARAAAAALDAIDPDAFVDAATAEAGDLARTLPLRTSGRAVTDLALRVPAQTMARVLGVPDRDRVGSWIDDFAACLAPRAAPDRAARGLAAAEHLRRAVAHALDRGSPPLEAFARAAGVDRADAIANGVGFLAQSHEATAALIGNAIVAVGRDDDPPARAAHLLATPAAIDALVADVLRRDPPVHNTRRFVVRDGVIAGTSVREGEPILVVLAAAQRDPRGPAGRLAFGAHAHACPGARHASRIAAAAIRVALEANVDPRRLVATMTYRPSANIRLPIFGD